MHHLVVPVFVLLLASNLIDCHHLRLLLFRKLYFSMLHICCSFVWICFWENFLLTINNAIAIHHPHHLQGEGGLTVVYWSWCPRLVHKRIAIAKCNLFFSLSWFQRSLILLFLRSKTLCNRACELHLYCWDHVSQVNEWCLVDCFHRKFRVSTQTMVCDYCIAKCKMFSACSVLLMALQAIFLWFKIFSLIKTLEYDKKKNPSQVYFADFICRYRTAF